jgi:lipid II:glycine glycyltransferase (peptidoglycan interpeptide bridge formation enzyme)
LTLDLLHDEPAIFAGLHKTARKNLRHAQHSGLFVRTLTHPRYAERIGALEDESMARTGGTRRKIDWRSILELSGLHPQLSRISGLFLSERDDHPEALLAFGWGSMQGDHASYTAAGTTRLPHLKASLSYPLLWDLILWAKREGATWFDMGGVTLGSAADPLKGISGFKRYFSRNLEEVSEEWTLEPHPKRTRLARLVSHGIHTFAALLERFSRDEHTTPR